MATIAPSVAARTYWRAWLAEDVRAMDAMRARVPDVASRCCQCGHIHGGPSIVGPACRSRAMRSGRAGLVTAIDAAFGLVSA